MCSAVNHLHSKDIIHRDLSPDNFLLTSNDDLTLKLHDFGHAKLLQSGKNTVSNKPPGLIKYMAPEELLLTYGKKADIWALGVCMYYFMTTLLPFDHSEPEEVAQLILRGEFDKSVILNSVYSSAAKDLVLQMLSWSPEDRPTARGALFHPFFGKLRQEVQDLGRQAVTQEFLVNLRENSRRPVFQREVLGLLVRSMSERDPRFAKALVIFSYIDKDYTGTLDAELSPKTSQCVFRWVEKS